VLLGDGLTGPALREALTARYDSWLAEVFAAAAGNQPDVALVAVGGLGRREPAPYSDLDLVLLHRGRAGIGTLADAVWYPVWDARVGLDHSVRTVDEALGVAKDDLKAALGLLELRHLAGDPALSQQLRDGAYQAWRQASPRRLPELRAATLARWRTAGELAFLLEPDLK
jgi:[protein-PII] uridylyltransferase